MAQTNEEILQNKLEAADKLKEKARRSLVSIARYDSYLLRAKEAYEMKRDSLLAERARFEKGLEDTQAEIAIRLADAEKIRALMQKVEDLEIQHEATMNEFTKRKDAIMAKFPWPDYKPEIEKIKFLDEKAKEFWVEIQDLNKQIRKVYYNR